MNLIAMGNSPPNLESRDMFAWFEMDYLMDKRHFTEIAQQLYR